MSNQIEPAIPSAIAAEPQSEPMQPVEGKAVTKMTHEVDTDDMFDPASTAGS